MSLICRYIHCVLFSGVLCILDSVFLEMQHALGGVIFLAFSYIFLYRTSKTSEEKTLVEMPLKTITKQTHGCSDSIEAD